MHANIVLHAGVIMRYHVVDPLRHDHQNSVEIPNLLKKENAYNMR